MKGLTEGRIVHYVLGDGPNRGECRPGLVLKAWDANPQDGNGCSNLAVFPDGTNDGRPHVGPEWETSVVYGSTGETRTWHWPQECPRTSPRSGQDHSDKANA